ncbi:MAG TPA: host-nuclease inhibitor Gam family protein [Candidatus Brocadiia bacterium]|nr:host-nuclease inhibitor Gam family protein [Candidatus Brocadiia bacterium]
MPKTKSTVVQPVYESWEEVDAALAELARANVERVKATAEMNRRLTEVRQQYAGRIEAAVERAGLLGAAIEVYVARHRKDLGDRKSRDLTHGVVGYRLDPPSLKTLKKCTWKSVLEALRDGFQRFIRTKEEVNKEALLAAANAGELSADALANLGCEVAQDEQFRLELRYEGDDALVMQAAEAEGKSKAA